MGYLVTKIDGLGLRGIPPGAPEEKVRRGQPGDVRRMGFSLPQH